MSDDGLSLSKIAARLAPVSLGNRNGRPYERRLQLLYERAWPVLETALRGAGVAEETIERVAMGVMAVGSAERPADDNRRETERHWTAVEHRLTALMTEEGLDLELAAARLGVEPTRIRARCEEDPAMGLRLELAWLRGTAKLHGWLWDKAKRGGERAAMFLAQTRDPRRFTPATRVITEGEIAAAPSFVALRDRIVGAIAPGHACETCGGCQCLDRVKEAVGDEGR